MVLQSFSFWNSPRCVNTCLGAGDPSGFRSAAGLSAAGASDAAPGGVWPAGPGRARQSPAEQRKAGGARRSPRHGPSRRRAGSRGRWSIAQGAAAARRSGPGALAGARRAAQRSAPEGRAGAEARFVLARCSEFMYCNAARRVTHLTADLTLPNSFPLAKVFVLYG